MYRINQVKVPFHHTDKQLKQALAKAAGLQPDQIGKIEKVRESIDARKKPSIFKVYTLDFSLTAENRKLRDRLKAKHIGLSPAAGYQMPSPGETPLDLPPVVIGTGPAGLFCALMLAKAGMNPIVLERGQTAALRKKSVDRFWSEGVLDPESNPQFGEGGAGTFSDGKLNTLVKDPCGRNLEVLRIFAQAGADPEICYVNKPHIGTDVLIDVVTNIRREIESLGGTVFFNSKMTDVIIENGEIRKIEINHGERFIPCSVLVLCIGHSARDTFEVLHRKGLTMEEKAFAVGVRIEHPQEMIQEDQFGSEDPFAYPAASYKVTHTCKNGRGVYSFCMCPGGYVVNASSEEGRLAVNGMSYHARDSHNANSAMIVTVTPDDFGGEGPLRGIEFQRTLERKAYAIGNGAIPQQLFGDFCEGRISSSYGAFDSCVKGAHVFADIREIFTPAINEALEEGIHAFGGKIKGFDREDAILSGVESRTSSPVRINRDREFLSNISGIYPCGEGAGYAGGITSAAMDGMRVAEEIIRKYFRNY